LLKREIGYNKVELQGILKRDVSVVSRLASIGEMNGERKMMIFPMSKDRNMQREL